MDVELAAVLKDVTGTGAYTRKCRQPDSSDVMRRANGTPVSKRYVAWFDPAFEFQRSEINGTAFIWHHMDPENPSTEWEISQLEHNIQEEGLRNPVLISCRNEVWTLHPGKCRAQALKRLKIAIIPAVFADYRPGAKVPDGMTEIRSINQLLPLFEGNIVPEMTPKGIRTPKKGLIR